VKSALLRDMVRQKKISMEEGTLMRTLLFMPGGLELHIGVCCLTFSQPMLLLVCCESADFRMLTHA